MLLCYFEYDPIEFENLLEDLPEIGNLLEDPAEARNSNENSSNGINVSSEDFDPSVAVNTHSAMLTENDPSLYLDAPSDTDLPSP